MASESIGLDDIIATMLSMGFEIQDCQDAITNGKLTVQAAIDWILSGKPGNVSSASPAPSLKLNKGPITSNLEGETSNPFVAGNVGSLSGTLSADINSSSETMGVDTTDNSIVSRSHLSAKQQQIKIDFEEKERLEARRKVHEEKQAKKTERERILKEIREDRDKLKITKNIAGNGPESTPESQPKQLNSSQQTSGSSKASPDITNIQVRLPSGQIFRQTFELTASLNTVWDAVYSKIGTSMNSHSGFIQPFPRREFARNEMSLSLQELGLVPSGSLVLKKKDVDQAMPVETIQPAVVTESLEDTERAGEDVEMEAAEDHQWGMGRMVEGGEEMGNDQDMDVDPHAVGYNPFDQIRGLRERPIAGNPQNPAVFAGYGNRLVPAGVPDDDGRHLNRSAAQMAAEAAAQRFAIPKQPEACEEQPARAEYTYSVHPLQELSMNLLARRLTDPCSPIFSINGLPEDLLQAFLCYLKKERLLRPKVLLLIPSYLLSLVLDYYPYTTNELLHSARIFVHLHSLSLCSCTLITDSGLGALKGMKVLKTLNLSGCTQITDACLSILTDLKNLQTLHLDGTRVTDNGFIHFSSAADGPQLLHLDLSRTCVTHEIFLALRNFKKLKSLSLKQSKMSSLSGVEGLISLESLDISETHIVTDSLLCLTHLPHLGHISLTNTWNVNGDRGLFYLKDMNLTALLLPSRNSTTDTGLSYISGFHLSALDLTNYTNVGDVGMTHIGQIVSLKKLLLSNAKVTDQGMRHLAGLVNLEVLFVNRTVVSNAGASIVSNFKNLNELSLSATSVTNELLRQGSLNSCTNLTKLNLSRTIVGDKGICEMKLPNLLLINLDCTRVHPGSLDIIQENCPRVKSITIANLSSLPEDDGN